MDVLRRLDSGQRQVNIAKASEIPTVSLLTIKSQCQAITAALKRAQLGPTCKRLCTGYFRKVDNAVATWLQNWRSRNIPVSGRMIQEKAVEFAALFDVTGFDASSGWLHRFRARYGLSWKQMCGDASCNKASCNIAISVQRTFTLTNFSLGSLKFVQVKSHCIALRQFHWSQWNCRTWGIR